MSLQVEPEHKTNCVCSTNNKKPEKKVTVPIVEQTEESSDNLPQGYAIEKHPDDNNEIVNKDEDEDEDYETTFGENGIEIDPNQRIHTRKSIANHVDNQYTNAIGSQIEEALFDDVDDGDKIGSKYIKALQDVKDNNPNFFDQIPYKLHAYGSETTEFSGYKLTDDENNKININTQVYKGSVGITYGKSYENNKSLKIIAFGQVTNTIDRINVSIPNDSTTYEMPEDIYTGNTDVDKNFTEDSSNIPKPPINFSIKDNDIDIKAFGGAQYKFQNGDLTTGTVSFLKGGGTGDAKLDGMLRYDSKKFGIYGQFNITDYINNADCFEIDKNSKNTIVTNMKFGFNNNDAESEEEEFQQYEQTISTDTEPQQAFQENVKKWKLHTNPYVISRMVGESFENGLGIEQSFKKTSFDSKLSLVPALQYSIDIAPKDEENLDYKHNIAFGGNISYTKYMSKSTFDVTAKIRNKCTIGHGNSFTATLNTNYRNEQVSAGVEAIYIKIPDSNYFGANADITYKPNKVQWLEAFVSGNYVSLKDSDSNLNGWSAQGGVRINF